MDLVLRNDTLCASEFAFDQLDADQPFTVMTIGGVVGRGESRVVKRSIRSNFDSPFSRELRLFHYVGRQLTTCVILLLKPTYKSLFIL